MAPGLQAIQSSWIERGLPAAPRADHDEGQGLWGLESSSAYLIPSCGERLNLGGNQHCSGLAGRPRPCASKHDNLLSSDSGLRLRLDQSGPSSSRRAGFISYTGRTIRLRITSASNANCNHEVEASSEDSQSRPQGGDTCTEEVGKDLNWKLGRRALMSSFGAVLAGGALWEAGLANAAEAERMGQKSGPVSWLLGDIEANSLKLRDSEPLSRIYDAAALGMPVSVPEKNRSRVWERLLGSRVIYLGEAESVPDPGDKVLELEIVRQLKEFCVESQRPIFLACDAFSRPMQSTLDAYLRKELIDSELKVAVPQWRPGRFEEYLPLLKYCRDEGVQIVAGGTPPEVLRTVQAGGIQALSEPDRRSYAPPLGGNYSGVLFPDVHARPPMAGLEWPQASAPQGPGPYHFAQARVMADHNMAVTVAEAMASGGPTGIVIVITGASHVLYGTRGSGIPVRAAAGKLKKQSQTVILLNRERQQIRQEGDVPEADFLWYSADKACTQNCFNRAEVARVMSAAGRTRDALPQDIQAGIDLGLVSPDVLKTFFELDQYPMLAAAADRFQGLRERWLADPRFLQRLCIEEAISISTTLLAQYRKRGERFWQELEYVITDTSRGAVVDFFTVWLPAPTLSFRNLGGASGAGGAAGAGLWETFMGNLPDNAFQRAAVGQSWSPVQRLLAVVAAGVKLFAVGTVSSLGTVGVTNGIVNIRQRLDPKLARGDAVKRSPVLKTALVYGGFLATSSNLRYQMIAGVVEHWLADYYLAGMPVAGSALSFAARTINSYWGTSQWVDLARFAGLQSHQDVPKAGPSTNAIESKQDHRREGDSHASVAADVRQSLEALVADDAQSNVLAGNEEGETSEEEAQDGKVGLAVSCGEKEEGEKLLIPEYEELHRRFQSMESFLDISLLEAKKEDEVGSEGNARTTTAVGGHHSPVHSFLRNVDDERK